MVPGTMSIPDLPGFGEDVAAVVDLIEQLDRPVVLCGHGYGGMVISEAGNHDHVERLVYLAAYCPSPGERVIDQVLGPPLGLFAVQHTGDGRMRVRPRLAARRLYGDLHRPAAKARAAGLLPSTATIHRSPATSPAWLRKRTTYVRCSRDRALDATCTERAAHDVIRAQLARGRSENLSLILDTSHCPFYSAPAAVAEILTT